MKGNLSLLLLFALHFSLFSACLPYRRALPLESTTQSWQTFEERWTTVHTVSGFYRIRWEGPSRSRPFSANSIFQKPGNMYLEVTDIFGRPELILTVTPDRITAEIPRDRLFFEGAGNATMMERLFSLPLDAQATLAVLIGQFVPQHFQPDSLLPDSRRWLRVEGYAGSQGPTYRFLLDPKLPAVLSGTLTFSQGRGPLHVDYSHFLHRGDAVVPRMVRLLFGDSTLLIFRANHLELNQPFEEEVFSPLAPTDYRRLPIEELDSALPFPDIQE